MVHNELTLNQRYRLIERAGSGGMATVYKAQDIMLRRLVAVKLLHESLTGDEEFLRRFQREAHAAANLSHPNIVTVHDIGQDGHRHFIVMEYVNGRTLKDLIHESLEQERTLTVGRALQLGIQICAGIGYAHRAGLVHCDVKPQNVIVTRDDRVKVADFGIARAMSQSSLHTASMLWGTPHYFAPEQAAGEPATPASDVYAIGIIFFEMLTGQLPFQADTLPALALKHLHEPPPLITSLNANVPAQLEQIINKVLSKEPAGRYRTAGQLERILRSYFESSQQETGPLLPVKSRALKRERDRGEPTSERVTQVYERTPVGPYDGTTRRTGQGPTRRTPSNVSGRPSSSAGASYDLEASNPDWTAIALGVIALVAMLGLIPLWYLVARAWNVW